MRLGSIYQQPFFATHYNCDLPDAEVVAKAYKSLRRVERTFRGAKSTLEIRRIYHQNDEATIGHLAVCFLALRLVLRSICSAASTPAEPRSGGPISCAISTRCAQ